VNEIIQSEPRNDEEERKRLERRERALRERAQLTAALRPDRVPVKHALVLLGNMSRARFYKLAGKGVFTLYKEGFKSTVSTSSINEYNKSLRPAKIGKQRSRSP